MECARRGCENVMCDRLSHEHGYICNDCFSELIDAGPETNIDEFMNSTKHKNERAEAIARFDAAFPDVRSNPRDHLE